MNLRHELMGKRVELLRNHKKEKIVAEAVSATIIRLLSASDYEKIDAEELALAAEVLTQTIEHLQSISRQITQINSELGTL
ncbi:MAG: hypothetical protein HDQ93_05325 [Desulfovibrio sp.]|nr:hypothetical protein [Desulfovibrio sp.]